MKIGVLTSSRADYGIYQPLLSALSNQTDIEVEVIAFGTHLSRFHGHTIDNIRSTFDGKIHEVIGMSLVDSPEGVANAYANTGMQFAQFWARHMYDLVFALGDRFEMAAAVNAGIPFHVRFVHLHGGETTTGAIDNIYRHQITLASDLHFTSTNVFSQKVASLIGHENRIHTVGALSLDNIKDLEIPDFSKVAKTFHIPESDFILCTFHPETVAVRETHQHILETTKALRTLSESINVVLTMPNADTQGTVFREGFVALKKELGDRLTLVENFGRLNYFSAVKASKMLFGNTSSGIIEAASFGRRVVNVGERQGGRPQSMNTVNVGFSADDMIEAVNNTLLLGDYQGENIYYKKGTAAHIINTLYGAF